MGLPMTHCSWNVKVSHHYLCFGRMEIGAPCCDLTADEISMQFYMKVTDRHTHMYMLNVRKVTMGTAWKSSRNKGRARLQGKSLKKNRACPLSNHPCMFIILHSIETLQRNTVVKTGTVSWFYPNNLQCYFEVVNNLVSNEEHFYSIWSSVAFNQEGVGILVFPQHHLAPRGWFNIRWVFISFQFIFSFFLDLLN